MTARRRTCRRAERSSTTRRLLRRGIPVSILRRTFVANDNLLGKTSRARTDDVLLRILKPRFVEPGPRVVAALATLLEHPAAFIEACYYEAARDDALLATFAEGPLFDWYEQGRTGVAIEDVKGWLAELGRAGRAPAWSENVRTKVARRAPRRASGLSSS